MVNTNSKECVFTGQVQAVSGSYRESLSVTCHDNGRLLTTNDVIIQFDNVAAKTAIAQLAAKVGIPSLSCPDLISSVYSLEKNNAATIVQDILETVTAENGVTYVPRMMGNTHLLYGSKGMDYLVIPNVKAHMAILRGGRAVKIDRGAHRDIGLTGTHPPKVPGDFRAAGRAPGHPSAIGIAIRHKCLAFSLVHGNAQFFLGPGHRLLHLRCHTPSPQFS